MRGMDMEIKQLMQKAEYLADKLEFEKAINLYKEIIQVTEPDSRVLLLVRGAWENLYLVYLNNLITQYPEQISTYIEKIFTLHRNRKPLLSIQFCSTTLEKFKPFGITEMRLRALRFKSSLRAIDNTYLCEDFIALWQFHVNKNARTHLVSDLLSISNPKMAEVFSKLIENEIFSEEIRLLFKQKLDQLLMFQRVFDIT